MNSKCWLSFKNNRWTIKKWINKWFSLSQKSSIHLEFHRIWFDYEEEKRKRRQKRILSIKSLTFAFEQIRKFSLLQWFSFRRTQKKYVRSFRLSNEKWRMKNLLRGSISFINQSHISFHTSTLVEETYLFTNIGENVTGELNERQFCWSSCKSYERSKKKKREKFFVLYSIKLSQTAEDEKLFLKWSIWRKEVDRRFRLF